MQVKERWADIPGWENIYQISDHGRLKSFNKSKTGRILSIKNTTGWYLSGILSKGKKKQSIRIHRLVAKAFVANPLLKSIVNHKDMNKQNNHYLNLEWVTNAENSQHAISNKPSMVAGMVRYNKLIRPKKIIQMTFSGKIINCFNNSIEAAKATGVCHRNILQVASRDEYKPGLVRKQAGGYMWKYYREVYGEYSINS